MLSKKLSFKNVQKKFNHVEFLKPTGFTEQDKILLTSPKFKLTFFDLVKVYFITVLQDLVKIFDKILSFYVRLVFAIFKFITEILFLSAIRTREFLKVNN